MASARGLYDDPLDRNAAVGMTQLIVTQGRSVRAYLRGQPPQMGASIPSNTREDSSRSNVQLVGSRLAYDIAMKFKDSDKKFSWDVGEFWVGYVDEYGKLSIDYGLSEDQKK